MKVDIGNLVKALNSIEASLPSSVSSMLDEIGKIGETHAKATTLYKGNGLRKATKFVSEGELTKYLIADTGYAGYVEFGNNQQGDKIYPKKGKVLRFVIDGEVIFRKWVRAHGPLPFMRQARDHMIDVAPGIVAAHFNTLVNKQ